MNTVVIKQEPADTEFESKMTVLQPPHRNDVSTLTNIISCIINFV